MADEEIKQIATSLSDLNKEIFLADTATLGFIRKLGKLTEQGSKASNRWTTFSRLVSGSPIWSIQNKLRAYIEIAAGFEKRAQDNERAILEQNQAVINQVQAYQALKPALEKTLNLNEQLKHITESQLENEYLYLDVELRNESNRELKEAIENSYEYNKAILEGADAIEAQIKGFKELSKRAQNQKDVFAGIQEQAKKAKEFQKLISDDKGRKELQNRIDADKEKMGLVKRVSATGGKRSIREVFDDVKDTFANVYNEENAKRKKESDDFKKKWLTKAKWQERFAKLNEFYEKFKIKYQIFMIKFAKAARPVLNFLFKALIMSMFVFMGILLFLKFAHDIGGMFKHLGLLTNLQEIFYLAIGMLGTFFGVIGAFIGGDYELALEYLMSLLDSLMIIGLRLALAGLQILWGIASGVFYSLVDTISLFFTSATFREYAFKLLVKFGAIFLIAYFVKYLAAQALLLIGIYALPLMMAVVITAAIIGVAKWLYDKFDFFASGGVVNTPLQVVGERGPELVNLPKGSRVHSNKDSKKMLASSGGNTINITINARDTSDAELRRIADKIGNMVNNKINRRTSSRTLG